MKSSYPRGSALKTLIRDAVAVGDWATVETWIVAATTTTGTDPGWLMRDEVGAGEFRWRFLMRMPPELSGTLPAAAQAELRERSLARALCRAQSSSSSSTSLTN